ncbi:MAG: ergothioneine biosynthesis protein EgtB [Acidimicrobiales bacterium]
MDPFDDLIANYERVRALTEALAAPLSAEDQTSQSMPDTSPTKWHRAHVTWFFETFVLEQYERGFVPFDPSFRMLFNSYYEAVGPKYPRPQRGLVTRPGAAEVTDYRADVDRRMVATLLDHPRCAAEGADTADTLRELVTLGLHHEQQHQELLLMDIKHLLSLHPNGEAYRPQKVPDSSVPEPIRWLALDGGLVEVGHDGAGFAFDNEGPRHRQYLEPFAIADRLVSVAEWKKFIADGGYRRPELWLSDGWHTVQSKAWERPIYWLDDAATAHTLGGVRRLHDAEPVSHISLYEADAFARWAEARLPTEFEWEHAVASRGLSGCDRTKLDLDVLEPLPAARHGGGPDLQQAFSHCWQWTASAYSPYPGFVAPAGAVGEYNAKFMSGQVVLRGSSSLTPPGHARLTYRNFFPPSARWPMTGLRLARGTAS